MNLTNFYDLKENMLEQLGLYDEVTQVNILFRESIVEKEWLSVNSHIDNLNELSLKVNNLDQDRMGLLIEITKTLHSKDHENFYSIIKKAPDELRDELVEIFYKLKSSIIQIQGVFKGLNSFVDLKKDISREIIDVLVNDSKGNVYTKPGRREQVGQGFLVNRQS